MENDRSNMETIAMKGALKGELIVATTVTSRHEKVERSAVDRPRGDRSTGGEGEASRHASRSRVVTFDGPKRLRVLGVGGYVPERVLTNAELEQMVETTDEWITARTGIRERRIASPGDSAATFGAEAARRALERAGVAAEEIDLVLVATATPDGPFPSVAAQVQHEVGAVHAAALDVSAACSGFVYGLAVANGMALSGQAERILLIGSEVLSRLVDWRDRSTCVLFGDGAGAFVLGVSERTDPRAQPPPANGWDGPATPAPGVEAIELGADGSGGDLLRVQDGKIKQVGRAVYRFAVERATGSIRNVVEGAGYKLGDVDRFVLHQANVRIMQAVAERLDVPFERFVVTADRFGNTSAASIPMAVDAACRNGDIRPNDLVVVCGFGGGLTWGSALLRW